MEVLKTIVNYILSLGAAVFVPMIMIIIGLCVKMKFSKIFRAALTLGIAFTGMTIVIGFMLDTISPAAQKLAELTGIQLTAIDGGWPGMASISWAWPYAFLMFPLTIGLNIIMLVFNLTKTLNVDMWNVWNKIFTAVMVSYISNNIYLGFIAAAIQVIIELKLGDIWGPECERLTGIPGVTVPHFITFIAVLLHPIDKYILSNIPFVNKQVDADYLKEKIGIFGENSVMGFIIGLLLGLCARYSIANSLTLAVQASAAMTLFPMISKLFSQALSPISEGVSSFMRNKFKDREIYIGLDWPILAGRNELWVAVIITIPFLLIFAITLPGNQVLPFAGIINLSFVVGALLVTRGNIIKMIIMGIITCPLFLYGATYFAPYITKLAIETKTVDIAPGTLLSWSTFEEPEFRYIFANILSGNVMIIILAIIWIGLLVLLLKDKNKYNKEMDLN